MIARTPPMGWNSWDCYGPAVTEQIVRRNAEFMASHLKRCGWEYIVVDIQWYEPAAVVYHKESMTARKGTPLREFYLSRARILYARRNISGGKKILSCLYLSLIAAPKKAVMYLLHGKCRLTISVLHGTLQGLITSKL